MKTPLNLLIIEDQPAYFRLLERHLQKQDFPARCQCVADLEALQAAIQSDDWDAVLSGYHLPKLNFQDALGVVQTRLPDLPVILVSGSIGEEKAVELLKLGVSDFVLKDNLARLVPALMRCKREAAERRARRTAQKALQESESLYHSLVEQLPQAIFRMDRQGRITFANSRYCALLGRALPELLGKSDADLFPAELAAQYRADSLRVMETGEIFDTIERHEGTDGRETSLSGVNFVHVAKSALRNPEGEIIGLQCMRWDVTDRHRAEQAVVSSEARYRDLFEHMNDGFAYCQMIFENDRPVDFVYLAVNSKFTTLTGLQDVIGKRVSEVIPRLRERDPELLEMYGRVATTGKPEKIERFVEALQMWFSISAYCPGQNHFVAIFDVITARKQAEAALRESEVRFRGLYDNAVVGFYRTTPDGRILLANPALLKLLGFSSLEELARRNLEQDGFAPEYSRAAFKARLECEGQIHGLEAAWKRSDGSIRYVRENCQVVRDEAGRPLFYDGSIEDITVHKQAEEALRASERKYRSLFENSREALMLSDPASARFLAGNPSTLKMFGATDEADFTTRNVLDLSPEWQPDGRASAAKARELIETAMREGSHFFEWTHRRLNGETFPTDVLLTRFEWDGATVFLATVRDLTERKQAEQAQKLFRALVERSSDAIHVVDPATGRFLDFNESACRSLGYTRQELEALTVFEVTVGVDRAFFEATAARMKQAGHVTLEAVHRRKDGSTYPVEVSLSPVLLDREYLVAIVRDITARKATERELQENEARLSVIFQHSPVGIVTSRLDNGLIVDVNPAFARLYGYTREELIGRLSSDLQMWPIPSQRAVLMEELRAKQSSQDYEVKARRKSGEIRDLVLSVELIHLSGEPFTLGLARDITERKRIEESHAQLATVVQQAAEAIAITAPDGTILYVNPAFEKSSGYTRDEAIGQNPRLLKSGKQDQAFYRQMWGTLKRGQVWRGHFVNRRKDGTLYEEEATISPVRDATGCTANFVAVKRDVTREVQLEAQYRQAQKMEAIGTLAGGIAHDFNNILAAIFGFGYLLQQDTAGNVAASESVEEVLRAASRAKDLVQQILTFSRQREQKRQVIRLDTVLKEATKFLRASISTQINIEMELAADAPMVLADPTQIYQVTMNLATNAMHAMEGKPGQLTIRLAPCVPDQPLMRAHPELREITYARLTIADTGAGMDAKTLERIFEPFFTTKPVGKGTGLGLAVVHGIVQTHEGVITVESEVGRGTTFCLYFPAQSQPETTSALGEGRLPDGQGQRILVLDDEVALTTIFSKLLRRLNYVVTTANTPQEAIRLFRENPGHFDLVLTDLNMPEMDGLEVARLLRVIRADVPVVLASGYSASLTDDLLREAGICEVLQKPVALPALAEVVHRHLRG